MRLHISDEYGNLGHIPHHSATIARTDLQGNPRSMIFHLIWKGVCHFLLTFAPSLTVSVIWPVFDWERTFPTPFIQPQIWKRSL